MDVSTTLHWHFWHSIRGYQRPLAPSSQTPPAYGHLPSDKGGVGSVILGWETPYMDVSTTLHWYSCRTIS